MRTVDGTNVNSGVSNNCGSGTVTFVPNAAGRYKYQCSIHPGMTGTLCVGDGSGSTCGAMAFAAGGAHWALAAALGVAAAVAAVALH